MECLDAKRSGEWKSNTPFRSCLDSWNVQLGFGIAFRLSTMMIWVFWFPSFPKICSRFICWLCGWRRTDLFWTLRSGFHQVLRHDRGFYYFILFTTHPPPTSLLLIIWCIKKVFWLLGHHTETFLIALPASPAHWDCWEMHGRFQQEACTMICLTLGIII